MELPTISNYGHYSNDNYGAHCLKVTMNGLCVWFSYQTPVAFQKGFGPQLQAQMVGGDGRVIEDDIIVWSTPEA